MFECLLQAQERAKNGEKQALQKEPRYIYKEGHSHYVTRDVSLAEILQIKRENSS
ncbi:hypothetical protein NEAUS04_1544 [Nematocida ausubeli]|nr:hypothetical protein NEAUS05_1691 [Nematocida ausubeli]KAI5163416.1 hypothetical protein NEAUS04_1544 [Nematocida ausubeli]